MSNDKPLEKFRGELHEGADRSAPYPVSRMAPAIELVDMAREIAEADRMLGNVSHGKLKQIAEQIRALQQQAHAVLESSRRDQQLHRARCNFQRKPGAIYHLYRGADGVEQFSMLSPAEWGTGAPGEFLGSYRLESDMSWLRVDGDDAPVSSSDDEALLRALLEQR